MKRQLSLVLALVMILGSFSSVFAAIPTASTDKAAFLAKEGILKGNLDGDLKLNQDLKRRDALVVLSRLFDVEEEAKAYPAANLPFTDINDEYYEGFVAWAVAEGYAIGKTETIFDYNGPLTTQQFATMLLRALGYEENGTDIFKEAYKIATDLEILKDLNLEEKATVTRGDMAAMTFNALYVEVKGEKMTLAEKLGIEMPKPDKPTSLKVENVYTENLAEIRVELSNAELVKTEDALYNPANYRLANTDAVVRHVHLEGEEVVLTLVPYGKVVDHGDFDVLTKGKNFNLTIRNIHRDINGSYNNKVAVDNSILTVEDVDFMGDYGIKVTTSEPIANPEERNFRLDSRTSMKVEQYGRDIILTPYHGRAFDKDAKELTIDILEDFAGYRTVKETHKMELSTDDALPKVVKAYRSGSKLVVEFDRDVYADSISKYESRRNLGNVSFVERRVPFYATEDAVKVDTNVVEYFFEREIPRGVEVVIEGVANHFNKAMEKDVRIPEEYKDDYAPVVISTNHNVTIGDTDEATLAGMTEAALKTALDNGFETTEETSKMTIIFDKDIAQFAKKADGSRPAITVADFFTLYELEITRRGESAANDVEINATVTGDDRIQLEFKKIKVNNKNRDYDYVLEVRNLSDMNGNRMDREYLDFVVQRQSDDFDVVIDRIRPNTYFNRKGVEIVLKFNDIVNKEEASIAKNYYLDNELAVDEAIVERDGRTVSLIIYDKVDKAALVAAYEVLEISPRVQALAWPYPSVQNRYWDLATETAIPDSNTALPAPLKQLEGAEQTQGYVAAVTTPVPTVHTTGTLQVGDKISIKGLATEFELENAVDQANIDILVGEINAEVATMGIVAANVTNNAVSLTKADGTEIEVSHVRGSVTTVATEVGTSVSPEIFEEIELTFDGVPAEITIGDTVIIGDGTNSAEGKVTGLNNNVVTITLTEESADYAGTHIKIMSIVKGNVTYNIDVKDASTTGVTIN